MPTEFIFHFRSAPNNSGRSPWSVAHCSFCPILSSILHPCERTDSAYVDSAAPGPTGFSLPYYSHSSASSVSQEDRPGRQGYQSIIMREGERPFISGCRSQKKKCIRLGFVCQNKKLSYYSQCSRRQLQSFKHRSNGEQITKGTGIEVQKQVRSSQYKSR